MWWDELWGSGRGHGSERERLLWPRWPCLCASARRSSSSGGKGHGSTAYGRAGLGRVGRPATPQPKKFRPPGRPSRTGCLPPPRQQLGPCASGGDLCGAVDCPWTPDVGSGRAFHLLGLERPPPLPSPCAYSKRTRGPDHTSPRGSESTNDPRALARRLLPRLQQRSVRRSLRRSPRRAAHAAAYEGPYAALPVVMGVPLLLPSCAPSHLPATCAPVAAADVNTATHAGF